MSCYDRMQSCFDELCLTIFFMKSAQLHRLNSNKQGVFMFFNLSIFSASIFSKLLPEGNQMQANYNKKIYRNEKSVC